MPGYKTHLAVGFMCGLIPLIIIIRYMPHKSLLIDEIPVYLTALLIGSLFPDIDIASKMQRLFYSGAFIACCIAIIYKKWLLFTIVGGVAVAIPFLYHRTTTHNYRFIIIMPLIAPLYIMHNHPQYTTTALITYLFFITGALSHIGIDRFTTFIKFLGRSKRR